MMKNRRYKLKIICVIVGILFCLAFQKQIQAQEKKPLNLNDIAVKLTFTSRIGKSNEKINEELIADVGKRKVNFILKSEDENLLRKAGAGDSLIKAIHENVPNEVRELEEQTALYKKYVENYKGTIEQKKKAIEAAKEFIEKYAEDVDAEIVIKYLKKAIPLLEKSVAVQKQID